MWTISRYQSYRCLSNKADREELKKLCILVHLVVMHFWLCSEEFILTRCVPEDSKTSVSCDTLDFEPKKVELIETEG